MIVDDRSNHDALARRGQDAERQADEELDEQARDRELEGRRETLQDERQDVPVLGDRVPEVPVHDVADVRAQLLEERAVQAERVTDPGDVVRRGVRPGRHPGRIGRQDVGQEERQEGDRREHGEAPRQSPDRVGEHGSGATDGMTGRSRGAAPPHRFATD